MRYIFLLIPMFLCSVDFFKVDKILKDEVLCLKKEPSIESASIGAIPYNTHCLKSFKCIKDSNKSWCKIEYFKKIAWVDATKLSIDNNCTFDKNISIKEKIILLAKSKLGLPYRYGKSGPKSFDCSGFVYYIFKNAGIILPRTSFKQSKIGKKIGKDELKVGDLVFFDTSNRGRVNHSGIYIGNGKFIHASSGKAFRVTISNLNRGFYKDRFKWGIRVLKEEQKDE